MEQLFERGALDVFLTPIFMKKGRPATKLSVLCTPSLRDALSEMLLVETTTFGVRCYTVERSKLTVILLTSKRDGELFVRNAGIWRVS